MAVPALKPRRRPRKVVDLALQGGGAYGAFTWGALDRLLEDERLEIGAVSGASAGAMNAVVLADGLAAGGRTGAREALRRFWSAVAAAAAPGAWVGEWIGRTLSPYQFNPLDINPLRTVLATHVDFERVRACDRVRLFLSTTNVRTGTLREFRQHEIGLDAVLASACLPMLFRTVEIDGEAYWDGGYAGNPSLLPLVAEGASNDVVLVQIHPSRHETVPTTAPAILERIDEITFNGSLVKELRTLALLRQAIAGHRPAGDGLFGRVAALRLHRIGADGAVTGPSGAGGLRASWPTLLRLHRAGRTAADDWLQRCFAHLGRRGTLDLAPFAATTGQTET
jgi:NTE family protein